MDEPDKGTRRNGTNHEHILQLLQEHTRIPKQIAVVGVADKGEGKIDLTWRRRVTYNAAIAWVNKALVRFSGCWWELEHVVEEVRDSDADTEGVHDRKTAHVASPRVQQYQDAPVAQSPGRLVQPPKRDSPSGPGLQKLSKRYRGKQPQQPADVADECEARPVPDNQDQHIAPTRAWLMYKALQVFCKKPMHDNQPITDLQFVGEGTFGVVHRGNCERWGNVCVKAFKGIDKWTDCFYEVSVMSNLHHPNIVEIIDVCACGVQTPNLVVTWGGTALSQLIRANLDKDKPFPQWRQCTVHLLSGVDYLHKSNVVHTDLKPDNLVVSDQHVLRIIDFGCAFIDKEDIRTAHSRKEVSKEGLPYGSLWYRSIEVLLGDTAFGKPMDMWAVACIVAEMHRNRPLFRASRRKAMIELIVDTMGDPSKNAFSYLRGLPLHGLPQRNSKRLDVFTHACGNEMPPTGEAWLRGLLTYDPRERVIASDAIRSMFS